MPVVPAKPVIFKMTYAESEKPQIVRICYLDEGTREIVLPPAIVLDAETAKAAVSTEKKEAESTEPQIVRVSNLDAGDQAFVVQP